MKLYEFAVLKHPTKKEKEDGKGTEIIVPVRQIVANDDRQASLIAGRAIPEEHLVHLDRVEVAVRPF